jgi:hypothetical protein
MMTTHVKAILLTGILMILAVYGLMWLQGQTAQQAAVQPVSLKNTEWTFYGSDQDGDHYHKIDTSKTSSPGIVRIWSQIIFNEEGKKRYIETRKKVGLSIAGYENLSHRNVLYELNCFSGKKELCIQEVLELTTDGKTLDYGKAGTYKDWSEIPGGSIYEQLHKTVCPEKR